MSTMNVSLPPELRAFVERRVAEGSYGTSSEYVRELIRRDKARLHVRSLILEGMSAPSVGMADAGYWTEKRRGVKRAKRRA
jgi:antitoxin ParD1/3/4